MKEQRPAWCFKERQVGPRINICQLMLADMLTLDIRHLLANSREPLKEQPLMMQQEDRREGNAMIEKAEAPEHYYERQSAPEADERHPRLRKHRSGVGCRTVKHVPPEYSNIVGWLKRTQMYRGTYAAPSTDGLP